jgi:hypothetical protein
MSFIRAFWFAHELAMQVTHVSTSWCTPTDIDSLCVSGHPPVYSPATATAATATAAMAVIMALCCGTQERTPSLS